MHLVSRRRRLVRSLLLPFVLVAALCVALVQPGATAQGASLGTAGLFVPAQGRIASTATGLNTTKAQLAANTSRTIQVTGVAGLPTTGVGSVLISFTVRTPATGGNAYAGPDGGSMSPTLRYDNTGPTSNSAVVPVSDAGKIQIQTSTATDVDIDLQGYYTSGSGVAAGGYVPVDYVRTVNTTTGLGLPKATLAGGSVSTIQVSGTADVPSGAAAVFVDFEVQNTNSTGGYITPYSASAGKPVNALNFGPGKTSIGAIVPLDSAGKIKVFLSAGNTTNLLMDVEGYFTPGSAPQSSGAIFTPKFGNIYDTRHDTHVAPNASVTIPVGGTNGIPTIAQGLSAITADFTVIDTGTNGGYARGYASGKAEPQNVSALTFAGGTGSGTTNLTTIEVGEDDAIVIHNLSSDTVDFILDLEGWYTTSTPDPTNSGVTGTGGSYVPTAGRLPAVTLTANTPQAVQIAGLAGVPEGGAGAVSLVITTRNQTAQGTLYAQATGDPAWSQVGVYNGGVPGNSTSTTVLAMGEDGTITFQSSNDLGLYIDVQGYYTSTAANGAPAPGGFSPLAGSRIVDTRSGLGLPTAKIAPGGKVTIQVAGNGGVPTGAQAVIANFTMISAETKGGYITPYAADSTRPATSLNYTTNAGTTAVSAQVALSADGKMTIENPKTTGDNIDLIIDVQGYFAAIDGNHNGMFTPATGRLYDSRVAPNTTVAADQTITIPVGGNLTVPTIAQGLSAVVVGLTAIHSGSSGGYGRAWASGKTEPDPFSSINYAPNSVRTNTITVPVGTDGAIKLHNVGNDPVDYIVDLQGWYLAKPGNKAPATPAVPTIYPDVYSYVEDDAAGEASTTPTFVAPASDSDGDSVLLITEIYSAQQADSDHIVSTCMSDFAPSGSPAVCEIPNPIDGDATFYARSKTRDIWGLESAYTDWFSFTTSHQDEGIDEADTEMLAGPADPQDTDPDAEYEWSSTSVPPADLLSLTESEAVPMSMAASTANSSGYSIPDSGWKPCSVFAKETQIVTQYYRQAIYNKYKKMAGSHSDLNCGRQDPSGFGYRHLFDGENGGGMSDPDAHAKQWQDKASVIQRNWRDLAGWATSWTLKDPDTVYWEPWRKNPGFCETREMYLYKKEKNGGWSYVRSVDVRVALGETGVRIITLIPNGKCSSKSTRIR